MKYVSPLLAAVILITCQLPSFSQSSTRTLDLSNQQLKDFPNEQLREDLHRLDFSGNQFADLPSFKTIPVEEVNLAGCPQLNYVVALRKFDLKKIKKLTLGHEYLAELPRNLWLMENLEDLKITGGHLEKTPDFSDLKKLKSVAFENTTFENADDFFNELSASTALENLTISNADMELPPMVLAELDKKGVLNADEHLSTALEQMLDIIKPLQAENATLPKNPHKPLFQKSPKVAAIIEDTQVEKFSISTATDQSITTAQGTQLTIPAKAFVDKNGEVVKGKIDIVFKDYYDPLEYIADGLDMTFSTQDTTYMLESLGMLDVRAFQNGQALELAEGKAIDVTMPLGSLNEEAKLYEYDDDSNSWLERDDFRFNPGTSNPELISEANLSPRDFNRKFQAPKVYRDGYEMDIYKAARGKYFIKVKVDQHGPRFNKDNRFLFPVAREERRAYGSNKFVFEGQKKDQIKLLMRDRTSRRSFEVRSATPKYSRVFGRYRKRGHFELNDLALSPNPEGDNFHLTAQVNGDSIALEVFPYLGKTPRLIGKRTQKITKLYESGREKTSETRELSQMRLDSARAQLQDRLLAYEKQVAAFYNQYQGRLTDRNFTGRYTTSYPITRLGIHNLDAPVRLPKSNSEPLFARFTDESGAPLEVESVTLICTNRNYVFNFAPSDMLYDKRDNYQLLAYTKDGRLAQLASGNFSELKGGKGYQKVALHVYDIEKPTIEQVRDQLTISNEIGLR